MHNSLSLKALIGINLEFLIIPLCVMNTSSVPKKPFQKTTNSSLFRLDIFSSKLYIFDVSELQLEQPIIFAAKAVLLKKPKKVIKKKNETIV